MSLEYDARSKFIGDMNKWVISISRNYVAKCRYIDKVKESEIILEENHLRRFESKKAPRFATFFVELCRGRTNVRGGIRQGWLNIRLLGWSFKLSSGAYLLYQCHYFTLCPARKLFEYGGVKVIHPGDTGGAEHFLIILQYLWHLKGPRSRDIYKLVRPVLSFQSLLR